MKLNFAAGLQAAEKPKARQSHHRLLVVDDEPTNLRVLEGHLNSHYSVTSCESGDEALALIDAATEDNDFSVILTDHMMPRMTGVELCAELRKRGQPAPRIIVTGFAQLSNVVEGINNGAIFGYLTKPVDSAHLLRTISEAVASFDMGDQNRRLTELVDSLAINNKAMEDILTTHGASALTAKVDTGLAEKPRRAELAVLFAGVSGLDDSRNEASAIEQLGVLQDVLEVIHRAVYAEGGIVDKHLGEGLMAVFGLSGDNALEAAARAGKRIIEGYPAVVEALPGHARGISLALGMSVGKVVLGLLGSEKRSELAIIGQTANRAARLKEFSAKLLTQKTSEIGDYQKFLMVCDEAFGTQLDELKVVELESELVVRDFGDVKKLALKGL